MAQPASRTDLINYCKRQLGAPVLEINIADEQVDDLVDDALQYFHERHFDGVIQTFLKYKITQDDIDRGRGKGSDNPVGIVTTTATSTVGISSTFSFEENSNFLQIPPAVLGINKIFRFDGSNTVTNNMFSVKYQLFLNDVYTFSSTEILSYAMTKRYLEDLDFALGTEKYIRFNKRQDRLYLDFDWDDLTVGDYIMVDMTMRQDPDTYTDMYNDNWLKDYVEALFQQQWGRNLSKYDGIQMLGGVTLNGRQILEDASQFKADLEKDLRDRYETPPLDIVG